VSDRPSLALDIGTRKVVGLLTVPTPKGLKITAAEKLEHTTRAMVDGQIHDVVEVAAVVEKIVQKLSAKAGFPLTEAAVAAAGRALKTFKGTAARELPGLSELTHDDVFSLELEAVQAAQAAMAAALRDKEKPQEYHYVGHSVMGARLDGLAIGNLVGQRGNLAELDVIATFLPRGVVDSLQAVLNRVGLEMTALTLEPIAALSVAVPSTMRHLNLVLVDVGAGTSDIAITSKGSVLAYDMVPIAGDEITEALSEAYLLDFKVGEIVKRQINTKTEVSFVDILGNKQTVPAAKLTAALKPAVDRLAGQIAERVLRLNNGVPPQAIMLVGGGSLTPGLGAAVAAAVGLPDSRVAVRGRDAIAGVEGAKALLNGPDAVTPIGIAAASRDKSTLGFHLVHVNKLSVRIFHPSKLTVADALLAAGVSIRDLQGTVGRGLTLTVNGDLHIVRGTFGKPARILVGDQPAALDTPIVHRDHITVIPGTPGTPGKAKVADLAPQALRPITITLDGRPHVIEPLVTVNGAHSRLDRQLNDNDEVVIRPVSAVEDVLLYAGIEDADVADVVHFSVDGVSEVARRPRYQLYLNGLPAGPSATMKDGDRLELARLPALTVREVAAAAIVENSSLRVRVNGKIIDLYNAGPVLTKNGVPAQLADLVADNDAIAVLKRAETPIFAHLLIQAGLGTTPPKDKTRLVMLLNGDPAEFHTPIQDGDTAEIYWE
jgi:cell division protein FtsA